MNALTSAPGAARLFAVSLVARLPIAMLGIGLLVHTELATHSYAAAGLVSGAFALAQGVGGPLLGRIVDRRGQTLVLVLSSVVAALALAATSALPDAMPLEARVVLALIAGAAMPPVGACLRTLFATLTTDKQALRSAFATDAAAVELTWVFGPPLVLWIGTLVSTGAALATAGFVLAIATLTFAGTGVSRRWRPEPRTHAHGAMRAPGMRTLTAVLTAVGLVFGAVEVSVAASAEHFGAEGSAGPLLALWGIGSLIGGLVAARLGGGARTGNGLVLLLVALAVGHLVLAAAGSPLALGALIVLAGSTIAPTFATVYAMVDTVAPRGTATEAFAWLATAAAVGASAGAAVGGAVVDAAGPSSAFVFAGAAAVVAAVTAALRTRTLPTAEPSLATV
ncbi:MAG TPA: MFS transporter [Solirubrobacter sp.]|nr:MFS transporter [Solirubrobacter sp.]